MFKTIAVALLVMALPINYANASVPLPSGKMPFKVDTENRKKLVCNHFGLELQKQQNPGRYDGSMSRRMLTNDLIYCVLIYKRTHANGYVSQSFFDVTGNIKNGFWEASRLR